MTDIIYEIRYYGQRVESCVRKRPRRVTFTGAISAPQYVMVHTSDGVKRSSVHRLRPTLTDAVKDIRIWFLT